MVLLDTRYRCATCGEPLLREGGNRLTVDQESSDWMCIGRLDLTGYPCPQQGKRITIPLVYVDV